MPATVVLLTDITRVIRSAFGGREKVSTVGESGAATTVDLQDGNIHIVTLTDDCEFSFAGATPGESCSFVLKLKQDAQGGRIATFPPTVTWPGGEEPVLSAHPEALDKIVFETTDGGQTWEGNVAGVGYA